MDEYILTLVMLHLIAESPRFFYIYSELWSIPDKDESDWGSSTSREGKIITRLS